MQLIAESLAGLRLGAPQVHLNLALIPLLGLAKERKDPRERAERMLQIPELMQGLMGGRLRGRA